MTLLYKGDFGMKNINDNNYIYASTLVRAADGVGTERERLDRALDCKSPQALYDALREFGIAEESDAAQMSDTSAKTEMLLNNALEKAVSLVKNSAPMSEIYDFLLYKYDCNNIKVAIKCSILNTDGKNLYYSCGTVSPETVKKCVADRDFKALPFHMGEAACEAVSAYEKTGEAREIDLSLDRACFADMAESARDSGVDFFARYTEALADSVNIRTAVRISDSNLPNAAAAALMKRAAVPGGTVNTEIFLSDSGVFSASEIIGALPLSPIKSELTGADSYTSINAALNRFLANTVSKYSAKPFGAEVPACFLINRAREITYYRKLAALISDGVTKKEVLKERLGLS